jgi:thiol:disulfide interchange protein
MRLSAATRAFLVMTLLAVLLVAAVGCAGGSGAAGSGGVKWLYDSDEALSRAQAANKPIVINFYTDVCPACRTMDATTFSNGNVSALLNANFICLKSNAGTTNLQLGYGIRAVPTTVFNVPYGYGKDYEIVRIVGAAPPAQFYPLAQAVLEEWRR